MGLMKLLVYGLFMGLFLRLCSDRLDDGSRALSVRVEINNMGGKGLSISVSQLAAEDAPEDLESYRDFR